MIAITTIELVQKFHRATELFESHIDEINKSNHFPVSDFDTGINMYRTLHNTLSYCENHLEALPETFVQQSNGNSGIILGQMMCGFFRVVLEYNGLFDNSHIIQALQSASNLAYAAVLSPKEGTMLSFIRQLATYTTWDISPETLKDRVLCSLELAKTDHDYDAGAKGLYYLMKYLTDLDLHDLPAPTSDIKHLNLPKYKYCTEVLCKLNDGNTNSVSSVLNVIRDVGDSINYSISGNILKLHIHTNDPFLIFEKTQAIGTILCKNVDNMFLESQVKPSIAIVAVMNPDEELFPEIECEYICLSRYYGDKELKRKLSSLPYAQHVILLTDREDAFPEHVSHHNLHIIKTYGFASRYSALLCKDNGSSITQYLENISDVAAVCKSHRIFPDQIDAWRREHPTGVVLGSSDSPVVLKAIYGVTES